MKCLFFKTAIAVFAILTLLQGCRKDDTTNQEEASVTTQHVNQFIKKAMTDVYLWYNYMPDIDTRYEYDSKAYFEKLLYKEDKWSFVTDNVAEWGK